MSCLRCRIKRCFFRLSSICTPEIAGEMIVADPCVAQRRVLRSGPHPHVTGAGGKALEALEHGGDIGVAEAIIAVAALLLLFDQPAGLELGQDANSRSAA